VGRVAYTKNGFLVCAERSNTAVLCGVYLWEDERLRQIGQHQASVTALEGVGDQRLISTGKDNQAILWEIPSGRIITQKNLNFWPRAARVSPDGSQAVLLDQGLAVINLPEMDFLGGASRANQPGNGYDHSGVSRCAVFLPQPGQLALGKSNGRVVLYSRTGMNYRPDRFPLYKLDAEVQGLEFLPEHSLLVTATSRGQILYTAWPSREQIATPRHLGERLTSLCFSQSGDFLATGDSDASMALWDLRALDFPELVRSHFSKFSTRQQEIVHSLVDSTEIPPDLVRLARFMDLAIRFRNRFDIQISDAPAMKAGEFDILVD
jgi:WD40 repeat protein